MRVRVPARVRVREDAMDRGVGSESGSRVEVGVRVHHLYDCTLGKAP